MIIYKIVNNINQKIYIGQTTRPLRLRWLEHCRDKQRHCARLARAIEKYGKDNFSVFEIDSSDSIEELNKKEIEWIKRLNSTDKEVGYNIEAGGLNKFIAEETREKLRSRPHPSQTFPDWPKHLLGIPKWSNENYKKPKTKEHAKNISENCHTRQPVDQYDLHGNLLNSFDTIKSASQHTGVGRASISACCAGRCKTGRGYIWKYRSKPDHY